MVLVSHRMDSSMSFEMIPGSVEVDYADLATFDEPVQTELPSMDSLRTLFEGLGISNESRVVIYSPDPIMAARAFVTLEVAGHRRLHVLNGGAAAWKAAGGSVTTQPRRPERRGRFTPAPRSDVIVDADWVKGRLGTPKTFLVDTRTTGEYDGTVGRRGMPSDGHLAGARLLLWQDLVDRGALKPVNELRGIYQKLGVQPGDTVVTYCFVGYRASFSYFVARVLGYESRFYDGSYQDWAHRHYPLTKGSKP
jgi:thiosulfate/3-mercaptopyruvate sulfurtransferase